MYKRTEGYQKTNKRDEPHVKNKKHHEAYQKEAISNFMLLIHMDSTSSHIGFVSHMDSSHKFFMITHKFTRVQTPLILHTIYRLH